MRERKISKESINSLPLGEFSGRIVLVDSQEKVAPALRELAGERLLGFDTEARPSFRKGERHPLALVQLATRSRAYLFQLTRIGLPRPLRALLESPRTLKVAQGAAQEIRDLAADCGVQGAGFVDLPGLAVKAGFSSRSLRALAALVLGIRISKGAQRSDWGRDSLSDKQQRYAATDAWACLRVFQKLIERGLAPEKLEPLAYSPPAEQPAQRSPGGRRRRGRGRSSGSAGSAQKPAG